MHEESGLYRRWEDLMYTSGNVTLMVADMDRAVGFYVDKLGLELKVRHGNEWAEVTAPGITLGLHHARGPIARSDPHVGMSIGLEVDDIEAAVARLTANGILFPSPIRET